MASSSSSCLFSGSGISSSLASRYKTLGELDWGVVKTFKPTHAQLVCGFLNRKIQCDSAAGNQEMEAFPELEMYGKKKGKCPGIEPWEIWNRFRPIMCPHQDYVYFYTKLQKLGKLGERVSRIVGYGGTWSETEPMKHLQFNKQSPSSYGKLRKFRYENKDKNHHQHAEWLMDEFTSNNSEWALCRIKMNDSKKGRKRKYEYEEGEEFGCSGDIFDFISLDDDDDDDGLTLTLTCLPSPLIQQFDPGKQQQQQQLEMPNSWDGPRDYCPVVPVQSNQDTCSSITDSFQPEEDSCDFSEDQLLELEMELLGK